VQSTQFALYEVSFGLIQLFAPVLPHITETLYQSLFKESEKSNSLHTTELKEDRFKYEF